MLENIKKMDGKTKSLFLHTLQKKIKIRKVHTIGIATSVTIL